MYIIQMNKRPDINSYLYFVLHDLATSNVYDCTVAKARNIALKTGIHQHLLITEKKIDRLIQAVTQSL